MTIVCTKTWTLDSQCPKSARTTVAERKSLPLTSPMRSGNGCDTYVCFHSYASSGFGPSQTLAGLSRSSSLMMESIASGRNRMLSDFKSM